jgi:hypothetical protein
MSVAASPVAAAPVAAASELPLAGIVRPPRSRILIPKADQRATPEPR